MERRALITGCSSGIGRATAAAFLAEEWDVVATARDVLDIDDLAERGCRTRTLDVTDEDAAAVIEDVIAETGRLDCLVNNAGYAQVGPLEDVPPSRLRRQFAVNVEGPHRLARAVLPHMRERGDGTIVNVSSVLGRVALPGTGAYAASKFALEAMSDALRAEVDSFGVDVVVVEPGPVATNLRARAGRELATMDRTDGYEPLYSMIDDWRALGGGPMRSDPDDVAAVIVNAASSTQPDARYPVGTLGPLGTLARFLPARIRDAVYRLAIKVTTTRGRP